MPNTPGIPQYRPILALVLGVVAVLLLGLLLSLFHYEQLSKVMRNDGSKLFERVVQQVGRELDNVYRPPMQALNLLSLSPLIQTDSLAERLNYFPLLAQVLRDNPQLNSVYIGWQDGDYLMLRPLINSGSQQRFAAPERAVWMAWHIGNDDGLRHNSYLFLNADLKVIEARMAADEGFDPRQRPWYAAAHRADQQLVTTPYVFFSTREFGTTLARGASDRAVLGADLTLERLSHTLSQQRVTPSSELILYTGDGVVIAYHDPQRLQHTARGSNTLEPRRFQELGSTLLATIAQEGYQLQRQTIRELEGQRWIIQQQRIGIPGSPDSYLAVLVPEAELLSDAYRLRRQSFWLSMAACLSLLGVTWLFCWRLRRDR